MSGEEDLQTVASVALKRALARGVDAAEVFVLETRSTSITALGPYVQPQESFHEGAALRVVVGGKLGHSRIGGHADIDALVEGAVASARAAPLAFAPPLPSQARPLADPALAAGDADRMSAAVERGSEALRRHADVTYARVVVKGARRRIALANSLGLEATDESVNERVELEARVTRDATERTAFGSWSGVRPAPEGEVERLAADVVRDARAAMASAHLAASVDRVILAPSPAAQIVGVFAASLSGPGAAAGKSPLAGRVGHEVVSPLLSMADKPRALDGRGRRALDDEGTPTRETSLVERGVLRGFLHNLASAQAAGVSPTGHGIRNGAEANVGARAVNLTVAPGDASLEEMVEGAKRAVLVTQPMMGAFVASRVTGDFSLVAPFAYLVEDGRIRHALPPTTVGGNALKLLASVDAVGREARAFIPGVVPALRAGGVSCAT